MSAALTLAAPDHLATLLALVERFHTEEGIDSTPESRSAGVAPLLNGIPHGAAYLIGPPRAPIGYIIVCFGWSVEFGGMEGFVDELYIRPGVRGRGVATEVLMALPRALGAAGLKALHLEVSDGNETAQRLYKRAAFQMRDGYHLMTRML
ncbi:GNAT family N-acetyltransferase [Sulfitobacter pseudonitzschiae]|uniref:GNAT family N-acetyltransferase n=1 Tax=Pseudosulfitobacter pseudonitzschiae TaxID=1402135 RepID=A0A9Q2NY66_9RHOB|nr:GNAT family N-acetyltransferase [Pseudosulfitobacter pseudonitzschiae]MBM2291003.1 GNAT family N-acetyltransferase [Pseudosulfitobacter pseudonitzschiae]MBM2295921.1 GNAT family N-acetyltransferase [Pseudosulfitobacter pseudonitzschiae]MBM2300834.1 GNAT family N-acetyltransferase [Pseudosulfitobacter pseudonitzschiae]MBM2310618.1 GNAT family N-acetyltransferase [Pseudosulfitobacter pseudonitzschiae]MBM2315531.1 GNAT family N-acetyltransferase [Pseudosulfitobacter pseudonitzschiae]